MQLIERARNILLTPNAEWQVIDREAADSGGLYAGYIAPLAAIGPIASFVGMAIIGIRLPYIDHSFRVPLDSAAVYAVVTYVLSLVSILVLALIIDALAPTFAGKRDRGQALKVAAYASTAIWVAGVFALVPVLGFLSLLGIYGLYLLYTGLPVLMKTPPEKSIGYTIVVVIAAITLWAVIGVAAGSFVSFPELPVAPFAPAVR